MLRSKLIPAVMAAVIAVGTSGVAFAATNGKGEDASEIQAALSAEVTAGQAIAAAEKNTGGRALEVGLEDENGGVLYEVKTITQDKVVEAFIDPATGQVIRTKEEGLVARMFDQEDKAELARLAQSPTIWPPPSPPPNRRPAVRPSKPRTRTRTAMRSSRSRSSKTTSCSRSRSTARRVR
jgi:hypothetical protein